VNQPLVSVVTPFYNTAPYLAQCIESVLAQTYSNFEYILSNNCSADGSLEIAQSYARRDSRIRLINQPKLLSQIPHYNNALAAISAESKFCKMVQADDCILPECLQAMLQAFAQSESIGLVSAYDLKGDIVRGTGYPYPTPFLPGKEMARMYLRTGVFVFGSPSTVMYRSSLVREQNPFYRDGLLHEDTEKCMEILEHWDFGFVHQVLSFLRADNESIMGSVRNYQPRAVDRYIMVRRFASVFLDAPEAAALQRSAKQTYYRILAEQAVRLRGRAFWQYHQKGLQTVGESLNRPYLFCQVVREILWLLVNPGICAQLLFSFFKRKRKWSGVVGN
jgi:glycosyltransferase involved in cell wall biosynthesis